MMKQSDKATVSVQYRRSFGPFGSELYVIARDGESRVYLDFNHDGRPEIGLWERAVAEGRFDELVRSLHASGYEGLEEPNERWPGERPEQLGEHREGEKDATLYSVDLKRPELKEVARLLSELKDEIRKQPVRVLGGQARWRTPELRAEGEFEVDVVLQNMGVEPLQISHPMDARQTQSALTAFFLSTPEGYQKGVVALPASKVSDAVPRATGPSVALPAGDRLTFKVRGQVPVEPGQYGARLVFRSWAEDGEAVSLKGTLRLELGLVTVR